jgi:hypothetical protein
LSLDRSSQQPLERAAAAAAARTRQQSMVNVYLFFVNKECVVYLMTHEIYVHTHIALIYLFIRLTGKCVVLASSECVR